MAIVTAKPYQLARPQHADNVYSRKLRDNPPRQIDPYRFPPGALGDLGAAGDTGIELVDDVHHQITDAAFYARVTAGFAVAAGIFSGLSLYYLWPRRR